VAKIFALKRGSSVTDEILAIARRERIRSARVEAIGGVTDLKLAYFDDRAKKYEETSHSGFHEVTGLLGNITMKDGKPYLHAHGTFARRDNSVVGGHLLYATVSPLLEVVMTPTSNVAVRELDEASGLNLIRKLSRK